MNEENIEKCWVIGTCLVTRGLTLGKSIGDWTLKCSRQARSKGRPSLFLVFKKKTWNPLFGSSGTQKKIVKNEIKLRKLLSTKVEGVKNSKKKKKPTTH